MHAIAYRTAPRHFARPFTVDALFRDFFNSAWAPDTQESVRGIRLNITEQGAAYVVSAELPGVTKEDIKVEIEGAEVSISAQAKAADAAEVKASYIERPQARFARQFSLPAEVDQEGAQAKYENGVLTLTLPKRIVSAAKQVVVH
jgi:HSP20 family protein